MNWKQEAIRDLKCYPQRKESIENIEQRIELLNEQIVSLKGISAGEPVKGGISKQEERWINNISERERLEFSLKIAKELIALTEKGLEILDERERRVLEGFYIEHTENHIDVLCKELHMEKSTLYRLKDEALRKFTISEYGTVEI